MQIYGPFRVSTNQATGGNQRLQPQTPAAAARRSQSPVDQLDLSSAATGAGRLEQSSPVAGGGEIRLERVAELRRQITEGSYETPEKLDAALDRMLDQLG